MTVRAITLGVVLGLSIAAFTYFNDQVIRQTFLIGNHLPASVFGVGLVLLLVVNPLLVAVGRLVGDGGDRWRLRPGEVGIILALGLAVCAWPGSNLLRYFTQMMAMPAQRLPVQPSWLSTGVMSYVPGQSPLLAEGYVADWGALLASLRDGADPATSETRRQVFQRLTPQARRLVAEATPPLSPRERTILLGSLNDVIAGPPLEGADTVSADGRPGWANRALLDQELDGLIPPPHGSGVLLDPSGHDPEVLSRLATGGETPIGLGELPWAAWWPTLRLWGGALLCAALATLCLIVIVHPQWAYRELLPYPTAEFVREMTRWAPGRALPDIASSKLFWAGLLPVAAIHLMNGLHAFWDEWPAIARQFDFSGLTELFPYASKAPGADKLFRPTIFASVIGFGFFVTTRVSLSIGLSLVFWMALGGWLLSFGTPLDNGKLTIGSNGASLRFGAYVAMTLMILYFGRRYYWHVCKAAVGLPRAADTPAYAAWAARGLVVFSIASVYFLVRYAALSPAMAVAFVALFLMLLLVLARINVETGLFYAQPDWIPGIMLAGFLGISGVGAEGVVVLIIASQIFAADPREGISPYLANALRFGDRVDETTPRALAPWLVGMVVLGLVVAGAATLWLQYNRGFNLADGFVAWLPISTIDRATASVTELDTLGHLPELTRVTGLDHLRHANPDATTLAYAGIGFLLLLGCAVGRIRLPWWPIHPILFLVWGTYPANFFAASFLLAAAAKWAVTKVGGAKAYDDAKPLMVGLIAGDLAMILFWSIVGTIYYAWTGLAPPTYLILPI